CEKLTILDIQRPSAFPKELEAIQKQGANIVWPCVTKEITDKGVLSEDGRFFEGEECLLCVREIPDLNYLPSEALLPTGKLAIKSDGSILPGVFAVGDMVENGLIAEAIASANNTAEAVEHYFHNTSYTKPKKSPILPEQLHLAWFAKEERSNERTPDQDYERCLSCGTCRDCHTCETSCPERAIRRISHDDGSFSYVSVDAFCIGCGICQGVCPSGVWTLADNIELSPYTEKTDIVF
ncbi:MAG: 4Fe-4S dicluster domain-containing protein, partial [Desulfovibrio sp.]|nr:4Fe-4S dicluster domain-containing protein [Desulfovibrio sp.]